MAEPAKDLENWNVLAGQTHQSENPQDSSKNTKETKTPWISDKESKLETATNPKRVVKIKRTW